MFTLNGKIAVVTGGGSGIGLATVKVLAQQGATVHLLDLQPSNQLEALQNNGLSITTHTCDVSDQQQVIDVFSSIGTIDVLVNNAGVAHVGNVENTTPADFDRIVSVNIKGVYYCLQAVVPIMKKNGGGSIVNVCSVAAQVGLSDRFAYSMSKGAVYSMTLSVAKDYLSHQIRCNCISPARVHTPFVDGFLSKNYPGHEAEMFEKLSKTQPIGRMGTVEEVAHLILYLSSTEAGFITGCDYPIDGGFIHLNT